MDFMDFSDDVWAEIPDVSQPAVVRAVRSAARLFCRESEAWRVFIPVDLTANQETSSLSIPADTVPVTVHEVMHGTRRLVPTNTQQMVMDHPEWFTGVGDPQRYILSGTATFRLFPVPETTESGGLSADISVMPSVTAQSIDDEFMDWYYETLLAGALGMLYSQAGQPWHNPGAGQDTMIHFQMSIQDAASRAKMDHVNRGLTTAYGGL